MSRRQRTILLLSVILVLLALVAHRVITIASLAYMKCDDRVIQSTPSASGEYVASSFVRNCGATSAFVTYVSLRHASQPFQPAKDSSVVSIANRCPVTLAWSGNELRINVPKSCYVESEERSWGPVKIAVVRAE
jgi:hypothetical protein